MTENFENRETENPSEPEIIIDQGKTEKIPLEKRVDVALEQEERGLSDREARQDIKTLSWTRKTAIGLMMGFTFLGIGCNKSENHSAKSPDEAQKINNTRDGFTDSAKENVKQRLKLERDNVKHMKESSWRSGQSETNK